MSTLEAQMTHALWDAADAMDWDEMDRWEVREPTMPDDEEGESAEEEDEDVERQVRVHG